VTALAVVCVAQAISIPIVVWLLVRALERDREKTVDERRELINRVQHPQMLPVKRQAPPEPQEVVPPPPDLTELARIGTIIRGEALDDVE
jgi:hypothetical protein